jgi:two-component system sensor histidine kinase BaeS
MAWGTNLPINMDNREDPTPISVHIHRRMTDFRNKKPDWWPENESWPPAKPYWRRMRGRFSRRMGCLVMLVNLLAFFFFVLVFGTVLNSLGIIHIFYRPLGWIIPVAIVLLIFGFGSLVWAGRGLRHYSRPFGDLLEAAGRITEGDYSPRVAERGPSEMRALARAFNGMAERLQLTEEQRRDLMADITHELRTPLTVIQGNLEGFLDGVYSPDEDHLKSILEETQILSRLVDDLRTLALAESGALQLKKEPTDLAVLIGETVSAFRTQADAAGVKLDIQAESGNHLLDLDPERIRQVISNLIANALRYTPRAGSIRVTFKISKLDEGEAAEVSVEDTGAGIAPDVLPNIFNRFYKSRDSSGTGLGLPIARHLVEAHGGTISAQSQPGVGTTIRIRLPFHE